MSKFVDLSALLSEVIPPDDSDTWEPAGLTKRAGISGTWNPQDVSAELVEYLRTQTIYGTIGGRRIPFTVRFVREQMPRKLLKAFHKQDHGRALSWRESRRIVRYYARKKTLWGGLKWKRPDAS